MRADQNASVSKASGAASIARASTAHRMANACPKPAATDAGCRCVISRTGRIARHASSREAPVHAHQTPSGAARIAAPFVGCSAVPEVAGSAPFASWSIAAVVVGPQRRASSRSATYCAATALGHASGSVSPDRARISAKVICVSSVHCPASRSFRCSSARYSLMPL